MIAADLIWTIKKEHKHMSRAEKLVADIILADIDFCIHTNISTLAAKAHVSEPTITRFCRSVGCSGFRDFKVKLAQSLAVGGDYIRKTEPGNNDIISTTGTVINLAHDALNRIQSQLDSVELENSIKLISSARQVLFFGGGGGSTIAALEGQYRLFRLGIHVVAHVGGQLQCMAASVLNEKDVVVAISLTGRSREMLDAVKIAQRYDATVIAITKRDSPLAQLCDHSLLIDIPIPHNLYFPTPARYALLGVVDIIAAGVALEKGPEVFERLRRIKYSLANIRGGDDSQPLGD